MGMKIDSDSGWVTDEFNVCDKPRNRYRRLWEKQQQKHQPVAPATISIAPQYDNFFSNQSPLAH